MLTRKDFERYESVKQNVQKCETKYYSLYDTYRSPQFEKLDAGRMSAKYVTDSMPDLLEQLNTAQVEMLNARNEYNDLLAEIRQFLQTVDDGNIYGIVNTHYICGRTWKETTHILTSGKASTNWAENTFKRWAKKNLEKCV